jgi:hypothetical protein
MKLLFSLLISSKLNYTLAQDVEVTDLKTVLQDEFDNLSNTYQPTINVNAVTNQIKYWNNNPFGNLRMNA